MSDLVLAVTEEYFLQIKSGEKTEEYRLCNDYWKKRLEGRREPYRNVVMTLGYPKRDDYMRRISFPYVGWEKKVITHKHFGGVPKEVYAIKLTNNPEF